MTEGSWTPRSLISTYVKGKSVAEMAPDVEEKVAEGEPFSPNSKFGASVCQNKLFKVYLSKPSRFEIIMQLLTTLCSVYACRLSNGDRILPRKGKDGRRACH
jgi:hypothetical protein